MIVLMVMGHFNSPARSPRSGENTQSGVMGYGLWVILNAIIFSMGSNDTFFVTGFYMHHA